jgi:hypothetical protein
LQAADIYLQTGEFEQYCEVLIEIDEWEKALVVAPAVSMQYWRLVVILLVECSSNLFIYDL